MHDILYVDDLLELNYAYVVALKNNKNYNLFLAETPEEAMKILNSDKPPKCIILDIDMPVPEKIEEPLRSCWQHLDEPDNSYGLVIAAWVKLMLKKKSIPIIILSSVPNRFDDFRATLGDLMVIDRLHSTPSDLLEELDKLC